MRTPADLEEILSRVSARRKHAERQKRDAKRWDTRLKNEAKAKLLTDIEWWLFQLMEGAA